MRPLLFISFFAYVMVSGCKSNNAFDYSEAIVKIESEFAAEMLVSDKKATFYTDAGRYDSAAIITQQMEDFAAEKLEQVRDLKAPNVAEGENFKQAAVRYFTYLKTIYSSFNKLTKATSDADREGERQRLARIVRDKDDATRSLQAAQQKFAAANNFRVEKTK